MTLNHQTKTFILDQNARYFGISPFKLMERSGRGIAKVVSKKFGAGKKIGIFCGLGNNGGDGFVAARYLSKTNQVSVFLAGKSRDIKTPEAQRHFSLLKSPVLMEIKTKDIPDQFAVIIEALIGMGVKGKTREPIASIIKKINRLEAKKIAIDLPAPGFKADLTISLQFPKTPQAIVVPLVPESLARRVGVGEVKALFKPLPKSHKGQNGKLIIVGGSDLFHGASLWALKVASRIVDMVFYSSIPENQELTKSLKSKIYDFICIPREEIRNYVDESDAILIGPGMTREVETKNLTEKLVGEFSKKRWIIDAGSLQMMDKRFIPKNSILLPHAVEFKRLFGLKPTPENAFRAAKKYRCIILLKGPIDYICSPTEIKENQTGNEGMTKGGTGDVLASLTAAFACKNDPFLSACAAAFVNGLAGDRLKERVEIYYNASDLADEVPATLKWCLDH